MKRRALLDITACSSKVLDMWIMRGFCPVSLAPAQWTDYTMGDAFKLRLMMEVAQVTKLETASYFAKRALRALAPINPFTYTGDAEMWVALVRYEWPNPIEGWDCRHVVAGRWEDLHRLAKEHVTNIDPSARLVSLLAFSATRIAGQVWREARERGLPEAATVPAIPEVLTGYPEWFREAEVERRTMFATWTDEGAE